mmetsp:Transcript_12980/g.27973  ORF Transcript_12980/g.27973 Transcript_12980/m.27973 type:complete len:83 (-) Transcript_12980:321-569(-)
MDPAGSTTKIREGDTVQCMYLHLRRARTGPAINQLEDSLQASLIGSATVTHAPPILIFTNNEKITTLCAEDTMFVPLMGSRP